MSKFYKNIVFADIKSTDAIAMLWFIKKLNIFLGPNQHQGVVRKILKDYENKTIRESNRSYKLLKLIGVGGYGFVFGISSTVVVKINIDDPDDQKFIEDDQHEFSTPLSLTRNTTDKELLDLTVLPILTITRIKIDAFIKIFELHTLISIIAYSLLVNKRFATHTIESYIKNFSFSLLDPNHLHDTKFWRLFQHKYRRISAYYLKGAQADFFGSFNRLSRVLQDKNFSLKTGSLIVMPRAETTSLTAYPLYGPKLGNNYEYFRLLFLQTALFILKSTDIKKFVHNDLKPDNILLFTTDKSYTIGYHDECQFYFDVPFRFKISDFDFAKIDDIINPRIMGSSLQETRWVHDLHFFAHKFLLNIKNNKLIECDENFFKTIHETFINPLCGGQFLANVKKNEKCVEGRLTETTSWDKKILIDFLNGEYFNIWKRTNHLKLAK